MKRYSCLWNKEKQRATFNIFFVLITCIYFVCMGERHAGAIVDWQKSEDNLQELVLTYEA